MNDKKKAKPELRFKGFTEDWEEKKLGEVAEFRRGLTYSPKDICDDNKGIRVLRSSNISDNTFILSEDDVFVHSSAINIPYIGNNDILITAANGSIRLVGKHCLVKGIQSNSCVPGGFMLSASTDIPDFLQASMGTMWYQTFITTYTSGGTGSISNLNKSSLEEQNVLFPTSLAEQEKIGTFFKELDDLIGAKEQELEKLRQLKAALLEAMFPSEDTSDHNRGGLITSELGDLGLILSNESVPNTPRLRFRGFTEPWEKKRLGEVAEFNPSNSAIEEQFIYVDLESVSKGQLLERKIIRREFAPSRAQRTLLYNDVLFQTVRPYQQNHYIVQETLKMQWVASTGYALLRPKGDPYYLYTFIYTDAIDREVEIRCTGTAYPAITSAQLADIESFYPPTLAEQELIGSFFRSQDEGIDAVAKQIDKLKTMKQACLEQMFA